MKTWRSLVLAGGVVCTFGAFSSARLSAPLPPTPRATIAHYNGNTGVNTPLWDLTNGDVPPVFVGAACPPAAAFGPLVGNADNAKAVVGSTWGPILNIGTCATGVGAAIIRLRTNCINGPTVTLPGCTGELLIAGTLIATLNVPHNGIICNVPNQPIPTSAVGAPWAVQAQVRGSSGGVELSSTIYGVVDVCF
jgi:hypothetical protein